MELGDTVEEDKLSLENMAILKDIETSNLAELNIWAKSLELSVGKNEVSVRKSLARYYKLELPKDNTSEKKGKIITIKRAELSTYYTLEEVDESVAEFEGRVEIIIDDTEQKIQHSIVADKINFNRTLNSVTALGNVEYIKTEEGKNELVTADSLTFNLTNWKGSFIKCISKQDKTIDEEDMVFYYVTGEIKKSDTEVMGMNEVTIQTVLGSPYFNISAMDLWMLDSSDFVIILPSIKVGHVPVFIAPFYYHSDNNLYFNPVYGVKSREGAIFQNTLYLMGSKPVDTEESDFSFLSFDNGEGTSNQELNGLTLVPSQDKTKYSSDYSKIMLDYYSNLGIFIGNETEVNFTASKTKITLETGLGFSRNIDETNGSIYSANNESDWNSSYIFKEEVPFRYMLYITLTSPIANLNFTTLSDPYFRSDFMSREENFQWVNHFTDQLDDGVESLTADANELDYTRDTDNVVTEYTWGIDFTKWSPNVKFLNPFLKSFVLDFKKIKIDFESKIAKEIVAEDSTPEATSIIYDKYDPAYKFYYPEELKIPMSLTLKGSFFDTSFVKSEDIKATKTSDIYKYKDPLFEIKNPTQFTNQDEEDEEKLNLEEVNIYEIIDNDLFKNETVPKITTSKVVSTNMAYTINVPLDIYGYWDDDEWNNKSDVDYDLTEKTVLYDFDPNFEGIYSLNVLNSFFTIKDTIEGHKAIKSYLEVDEQDNLLSMYKNNNNTKLTNDISSTLDIFKVFPDIKKHSLKVKYDLNKILYEITFDNDEYILQGSDEPVYQTNEFEWTEDFITKNEISGTYKYDLSFSETSLVYKKILPPFDDEDTITLNQVFDFDIFDNLNNTSNTTAEYNTTTVEDDIEEDEITEIISLSEVYKLEIMGVTASAGSGFDYSESYIDIEEDEDEWDFKPIKFKAGYKLSDFLNISLSSDYSIEDENWEFYSGTLSLWDFDFTLNSSYKKPIVWDLDSFTWSTNSGEDEVLKTDSLTIKHNLKLNNLIFWKNRIEMDIISNLTLKKEFIKVDKSYLKYNLTFNLDIFEFLSLKFVSKSSNKSLYQYWQSDMDTLGLTGKNKDFLGDLIKSFNFFGDDDADRIESSFNLDSISVDCIYKMPDWNLIFNYTGSPVEENNKKEWYQEFSIFIEWKPLKLVRSEVINDDENWSVSTSAQEE